MLCVVQVAMSVERVFGCQDNIQVRYSLTADTATAGLDYVDISNSAIRLDAMETSGVIIVQVDS